MNGLAARSARPPKAGTSNPFRSTECAIARRTCSSSNGAVAVSSDRYVVVVLRTNWARTPRSCSHCWACCTGKSMVPSTSPACTARRRASGSAMGLISAETTFGFAPQYCSLRRSATPPAEENDSTVYAPEPMPGLAPVPSSLPAAST
ncbi:hypothetical protein ND450_16050 [Lentzea sp. HUAS12]|nr:hypothetical protein [Lentzea sp. HUAS12]USX55552.1 hypothetical protein ND450_16050 [Lentzea sp. HUAS12]